MTSEQETIVINKIKDIICEVYEAIYVGKMKVEEIEGGYVLSLYMNKDFLTPTCKMYKQCTSIDEFLDYVRESLLERDLNLTRYYVGEKIDLNDYKKRNRRAGQTNPENKSYNLGSCL